MTLSEYVRLKNCIVYEVGSYERRRELLHALKGLFRGDINSPRRFEQITTIGELLEILEVRDVLSEDNVTPFKTIAERLPLPKKKKLLEAIARYENQHVPRIHVNYYDIENFNLEPIIEKKKVDPYFPIVSAKKLDRIWLTIREELGTFWRDLGRHLRIRECVIQDIDKPNRSLQLKAKLLLEYYEQRADPQKWFLILCEALEKSRRKDLSRKIQDIMIMNM